MYPAGESPAELASAAFRDALLDANMLIWNSASDPTQPLFPTAIFDVRLGGDAGMVGSNRQITLPLSSIIISVGRPYGTETGYAGESYKDALLWVPFRVWANTGGTLDDIETRLNFARDNRQNVFSSHGLNLVLSGIVGARPVEPSPITGLDVIEYRWRFRYSRGG